MNWKIAARYVGMFFLGYGLTGIVLEIAKARKAVTAESPTAQINTNPRSIFKQQIHEAMTAVANDSLYTGIRWGWGMHQNGWTLEETLKEYTNRWYRTNQ